jgi:hypothetical protein
MCAKIINIYQSGPASECAIGEGPPRSSRGAESRRLGGGGQREREGWGDLSQNLVPFSGVLAGLQRLDHVSPRVGILSFAQLLKLHHQILLGRKAVVAPKLSAPPTTTAPACHPSKPTPPWHLPSSAKAGEIAYLDAFLQYLLLVHILWSRHPPRPSHPRFTPPVFRFDSFDCFLKLGFGTSTGRYAGPPSGGRCDCGSF